jgi:hypothetical protein
LGLDWIGVILCVGMTTCLLLPLQQGGNTKPWSDPSVYALFPVFFVLLVAFISTSAWFASDRNNSLTGVRSLGMAEGRHRHVAARYVQAQDTGRLLFGGCEFSIRFSVCGPS